MARHPDPTALLASCARTPDTYPHALDLQRRAALLVALPPGALRAASFLDERMLAPTLEGAWFGLAEFEGAAASVVPRPLHLLLHTGHVGSTLLSRLLEDLGGVLALREPLPLRALAEAGDQLGRPESLVSGEEYGRWLALFARLWARGHADTRLCLVKATSSAARVAWRLLERDRGLAATYLNLRPEPYLATLLGGRNAWQDLRGHSVERYRRLARSGWAPDKPLHALSMGELAALSWLAETATRHDLARRFPGRVLALDFDTLLADVPAAILATCAHAGLACDAATAAQVAAGPTLQRYAKAPEHAYGPGLRAQVLAASRLENAGEISAGLRWLDGMAKAWPELAAIVAA